MFIRVKTTPNSPRKSVQICESVRRGESVKQTIVRHVGIAMDDDELKNLKALAEHIRLTLEQERSQSLPLLAPENLLNLSKKAKKRGPKGKAPLPIDEVRLKNLEEETRVIEGIQDIFGALFDELGFNQILENSSQKNTLKATVIARIANPESKHRTAALLEQDFGISIPLDRIYRMMDALYERRDVSQARVFEATQRLFPEKIDLVFFDVTTLYFESIATDELRNFGYSKDQKFHMTQVVLALATTDRGLPVGYRLFSGNTAEVSTLIQCITEWKKSLPIESVLFVADRAMFCKDNLDALEAAGLKYIVAAPLRKLKAEIKSQILGETGYHIRCLESEGLYWVKELRYSETQRLITSFSTARARKDSNDRVRILEKLQTKLGNKPKQKKLISNSGYLKFTKTDNQAIASIDLEKVDADSQWDGMHGVITNGDQDALDVLRKYRKLWTIEESFRINKHDLKMRPIYHWNQKRIEAHIAICYLAYALSRHAQYRISLQQKPMSLIQIRNELLRVQSSILRDKTTSGRYRLPSAMTPTARQIYHAFGVERSLTPTQLQS
jgi:hypothetical protein